MKNIFRNIFRRLKFNNNRSERMKRTISFRSGPLNNRFRRQRPFGSFINRKSKRRSCPRRSTSAETNYNFIRSSRRIIRPRHRRKPSVIRIRVRENAPMKRRSSNFRLATTSSPIPSVPIVPARVLKGKKFKRGGRMASRAFVSDKTAVGHIPLRRLSFRTSRNHAAAKRRLNSTAAGNSPSVAKVRWVIHPIDSSLFFLSETLEPKASVVIIAEDATRIDSKTTTLGLSSTGACPSESEMLKSSSTTNSTRSSTRRRVKSAPREVILFRNGTFVSKEPIAKQQQQTAAASSSTTTLCFETSTGPNSCSLPTTPLHQQQITATGLQAAAQIVACNVLRQATLNGNDGSVSKSERETTSPFPFRSDALIEQLIKREPSHTDDEFPIYCYSSPSLGSSSCGMTTALDEYENSCSTTLKILGCNTTAPFNSAPANNTTTTTTTTTTIELLTFAALQQQQQQQQAQPQFCYIKQEPSTTTTTTTTFLLPRLLPQWIDNVFNPIVCVRVCLCVSECVCVRIRRFIGISLFFYADGHHH